MTDAAPSQLPPLVTVGMPTCGRSQGLRRALESVLDQDYPNLEVLISENPSEQSPAYEEVHREFGQDPRVRYVRQAEDIGVFANFRFVLQQARGAYFLWFADDDLCETGYITSLAAVLNEQPGVVLSCCDVKVIDAEGAEQRIERLASLHPEADWRPGRREFFRVPVSNVFYAIYGMYRTDLLRREDSRFRPGWKGLTTNNEVPLLAWMATLGEIRAVPRALKWYRIHDASVYAREAAGLGRWRALRVKLFVRRQLLAIVWGSGLNAWTKLQLSWSTLVPAWHRLWAKIQA